MPAIFKREFLNYFRTKTAIIFAISFIFLANFCTFYIGGLFEVGEASLQPFFIFHPWLYCFLLPALSMALYAEESKRGSIEVLFSLPISTTAVVLGKFLAAWAFAGVCLILTFPLWLTLNLLADPDNAAAASGYLASLMIAGSFLALGANLSAATKSQTSAFVMSMIIIVFFLVLGSIGNIGFLRVLLPEFARDLLYSFNPMPAYDNLVHGLINGADLIFFISFIALALLINVVLLERKKL